MAVRTATFLLCLWLGFALAGRASAQCYPGLACPPSPSEPAASPPAAPPAMPDTPRSSAAQGSSQGPVTNAIEPSFACASAKLASELLICQNTELSLLDVKLDAVYTAAVKKRGPAAVKTLRDEQQSWIKQRDGCGPSADCIRTQYLARISQLSRQ